MTSEDNARQSTATRPSLFLERQSYRRRRLSDAARLLPFLGAALIGLPLLWPDGSAGEDAVPLSSAILYIFGCWGALILISMFFGFVAKRFAAREDTETDEWRH
ncbi:hypothetical protein [Ruegeria arenilitoris]|uniref:hypothetical protein n=1 Tax=Ruegeria arenilitoris TaxID=1173585 RepID=UPI00147F9F9A|nr:hypothetical protein [Ruegeria arenilitoris]